MDVSGNCRVNDIIMATQLHMFLFFLKYLADLSREEANISK